MQFHTFPAKRLAIFTLAALVAGTTQAQSLITNGDFETGKLTGWTSSSSGLGGGAGVGTFNPHTGSYAASMGGSPEVPDSSGSISQSFATMAGAQYQLSFWVAIGDVGRQGMFSASINSSQVFSQSGTAGLYALNTLTFTATSSLTTLAFSGAGIGGARVDDVSVAAVVPEPAEWALLSAGLLAVGATVRRRRIR